MPELPEIETLTRDLGNLIPSKTIIGVECGQRKAIAPSVEQFTALARGEVTAVLRRAKSFVFRLDHAAIWFHMGLGGQVVYEREAQAGPALVALKFSDGSRFAIVSSFMGHAHLLTPEESEQEWQRFGVEPLDQRFSVEVLENLLAVAPRRTLKAALMDQSTIAGIGNAYSDEILHAAKLHPATKAGDTSQGERRALYEAIRGVMALAIEQGGEPQWVGLNGQAGRFEMQIHRRKTCGRCGAAVHKCSLQGRTSYSCPSCQPQR